MAAKALRRGGVRLRSIGSGHTSLKLVISELSSLRQTLKDSTTAHTSVSHSLMKFGHNEDNPALQDILFQMNELTLLWTEAQAEYIGAMKEYKKSYLEILESEKKLDQAKKHLAACEDKERKYEKELLKGAKDTQITKEKLELAKDNKELAIAEVAGQQKETKAVKLMQVKAGLLDHSQAWLELGTKCCVFAEAQRELAELIPESNPHTDEIPSYTGVRESSTIIRNTRLKVSQPNATPGFDRRISESMSAAQPPSKSRRPKSASYSYSYSENYDSFDSFDEDGI